MSVLVLIAMVLWTTARHEGSHALAAWLEGAEISEVRLLPGVNPELGFYFGYVVHSGETTWLTAAAPFLADAVVLLCAGLLIRWLAVGPRGRFAFVMLGLVSPLADLVYNYQGGLWREGTDVRDLFLALPDAPVHGFFLLAITTGALLLLSIRGKSAHASSKSSS